MTKKEVLVTEQLSLIEKQLQAINRLPLMQQYATDKLILKEISVLAIRLYPSSGPASFRRNPFFRNEFLVFFEEIQQQLPQELYLECKQHRNIIYLIFNTPQGRGLNKLFQLALRFNQLLENFNIALQNIKAPLLKAVMALDYGNSYIPSKSETKIWLGDVIDRTEGLVQYQFAEKAVDFLVSQSVYQALDPQYQNNLPTAYYINHIACYGTILAISPQKNDF